MNSKNINTSIDLLIGEYKNRLSGYPEELFNVTPPIQGWSFSEVYSHIFDSSILSVLAIKNCINGNGENHHTHFLVKMILFFGTFPPAKRYKVPKRLAERVKKISKAEALKWIDTFEKEIRSIDPEIHSADFKIKTKHPRLGYLNATQWLRFIEIHLKHHLKQLKRIQKGFDKAGLLHPKV